MRGPLHPVGWSLTHRGARPEARLAIRFASWTTAMGRRRRPTGPPPVRRQRCPIPPRWLICWVPMPRRTGVDGARPTSWAPSTTSTRARCSAASSRCERARSSPCRSRWAAPRARRPAVAGAGGIKRQNVLDESTWDGDGAPAVPRRPALRRRHSTVFLQGSTQYDALGHVWYDGKLWNGYDATTTVGGMDKASVLPIAEKGVVGRGVLIDMARHRGKDWLDKGETFDPRRPGGRGQGPGRHDRAARRALHPHRLDEVLVRARRQGAVLRRLRRARA